MKKAVIVLGMHRSGTSAITAGLEALGFSLGQIEHKTSEENPKGFFENWDIVELNDRLLGWMGGRWDAPGFRRGCDGSDPEIAQYTEEAIDLLRRYYGDAEHWALKDPRLCLTLPFWSNAIAKAGMGETIYIHMIRNPLEVARSQHMRHKMNPGFHIFGDDERYTLLLWYIYHQSAIQALDHDRNVVVDHGRLITAPAETLNRVAALVGERPERSALAWFESSFIEGGLYRHEATLDELDRRFPVLGFVGRAYKELLNLASRDTVAAVELRQRYAQALAGSGEQQAALVREFLGILTSAGSVAARIGDHHLRVKHHLENAKEQLENAKEQLEQEIATLKRSTSWRLTRPVRVIGSALRRAGILRS